MQASAAWDAIAGVTSKSVARHRAPDTLAPAQSRRELGAARTTECRPLRARTESRLRRPHRATATLPLDGQRGTVRYSLGAVMNLSVNEGVIS
jgi:hypothetical protein